MFIIESNIYFAKEILKLQIKKVIIKIWLGYDDFIIKNKDIKNLNAPQNGYFKSCYYKN